MSINLDPNILLIAVSWLAVAYVYWRYWKRVTGSAFLGFDHVFFALISVLIVSRVLAEAIDRYVFGEVFTLRGFLLFTDFNFFYLAIPLLVFLSHQFFVFNIRWDKRWIRHSLVPLLFGWALVLPISIAQLMKAFALGWPSSFQVYHAAHIGIAIGTIGLLIWGLRNSRSVIEVGLAALVLSSAGVIMSLLTLQVFPTEESRFRIVVLIILAVVALVPYLSRTVWQYRKSISRNQS